MIREITVKSVLQASKLPASSHCLNPYVGCHHACAYCYARFMRRFTGHKEPWGRFVDVKKNTPDILARQLAHRIPSGSTLVGSVCDAYQPLERRYGITREAVRQLVAKKVTFSLLTKSDLVVRDIDLLQQAGSRCSVGISLAMLNDGYRRCFEPGAAAVSRRLKALKELHCEGIRTYLFIGPILPRVTDVGALVAEAAANADEIWGEALNLRCGNRNDVAKAYAAAHLPDDWELLAKDKAWLDGTITQLENACRRHGRPLFGFYNHHQPK
jgi:DNA repair photolyase